jgi:hypothetical protein
MASVPFPLVTNKWCSVVVGRTPWSAADPLVGLLRLGTDSHQADQGGSPQNNSQVKSYGHTVHREKAP